MDAPTFAMSADCTAIFEALSAFQGEVESVKKDAVNPHFDSKFASLAEVIETVKTPLSKHGLSLIQFPTGGDGNSIALVTIVAHKSGQWLRACLQMPLDRRTPQAVGSAISYARRYCAMAALGIAADDDDAESAEDRDNAGKKQLRQQRPQQGGRQQQQRPLGGGQASTTTTGPAQRTGASPSATRGDDLDEYGIPIPKVAKIPLTGPSAPKHLRGLPWTDTRVGWLVEQWYTDPARRERMSADHIAVAEYAIERRRRRKAEEEAAERALQESEQARIDAAERAAIEAEQGGQQHA